MTDVMAIRAAALSAAAAAMQQGGGGALQNTGAGNGGDEGELHRPRGREAFSDQVRSYLESVYNVSAQPEEYVKYRLHLVTGLEMQQINDWFHNRRQKDRKRARDALEQSQDPAERQHSDGSPSAQPQQQTLTDAAAYAAASAQLPAAGAFAALPRLPPLSGLSAGGGASGSDGISRPAASLVAPAWQLSVTSAPTNIALPQTLPTDSINLQQLGHFRSDSGREGLAALGTAHAAADSRAAPANGPQASASAGAQHRQQQQQQQQQFSAAAQPPAGEAFARFHLEDLAVIADLVGLDTIACQDGIQHEGVDMTGGGLYLFEQLTRLDSLAMDGTTSSAKRQRSRHQHFWRNSDKIPRQDRVYVQSKAAAAAQDGGPPVEGRGELPAGERNNAWTVCLTPRGVVDYLNRKTSPIGVRLFRAVLRHASSAATAAPAAPPHAASAAATSAALPAAGTSIVSVADVGQQSTVGGSSSHAGVFGGGALFEQAAALQPAAGLQLPSASIAAAIGGGRAAATAPSAAAAAAAAAAPLSISSVPQAAAADSMHGDGGDGGSRGDPARSSGSPTAQLTAAASLGIGGFLKAASTSPTSPDRLRSNAAAEPRQKRPRRSASGGDVTGESGGSPAVAAPSSEAAVALPADPSKSAPAVSGGAITAAASDHHLDAVILQAKKVVMPLPPPEAGSSGPAQPSLQPQQQQPPQPLSNNTAGSLESPVEAYRRMISGQGRSGPGPQQLQQQQQSHAAWSAASAAANNLAQLPLANGSHDGSNPLGGVAAQAPGQQLSPGRDLQAYIAAQLSGLPPSLPAPNSAGFLCTADYQQAIYQASPPQHWPGTQQPMPLGHPESGKAPDNGRKLPAAQWPQLQGGLNALPQRPPSSNNAAVNGHPSSSGASSGGNPSLTFGELPAIQLAKRLRLPPGVDSAPAASAEQLPATATAGASIGGGPAVAGATAAVAPGTARQNGSKTVSGGSGAGKRSPSRRKQRSAGRSAHS